MLPKIRDTRIPPSHYAISTMGYLFLQLVQEIPIIAMTHDDLRDNIIGELETFFQSLDDFPGEAKIFIRDLNQELDGGVYRDYDEIFTQDFYDNLIASVKRLASENMADKIIASFDWMQIEGVDN